MRLPIPVATVVAAMVIPHTAAINFGFGFRPEHAAAAAQTMECPGQQDMPVTLNGGELVEIYKSRDDELCTIMMTDGVANIVPVARSFNGSPWERYSGKKFSKMAINCGSGGGRKAGDSRQRCSIDLPPPAKGMFYSVSGSHTAGADEETKDENNERVFVIEDHDKNQGLKYKPEMDDAAFASDSAPRRSRESRRRLALIDPPATTGTSLASRLETLFPAADDVLSGGEMVNFEGFVGFPVEAVEEVLFVVKLGIFDITYSVPMESREEVQDGGIYSAPVELPTGNYTWQVRVQLKPIDSAATTIQLRPPTPAPSTQPSTLPSSFPSKEPSSLPSLEPSSAPSAGPSAVPTSTPTRIPTATPSGLPSSQPSLLPSALPSVEPSQALLTVTNAAVHLHIPEEDTTTVLPDIGNQTVQINFCTQLCALMITDDTNAGTLIPVARSYGGFGWERYTGDTAVDIELDCDDEGESCTLEISVECDIDTTVCSIYLPSASGRSYALLTSSKTLGRKDEYARFLEQATFGTTRDELSSLQELDLQESLPASAAMAQWIQDQQTTVEASYHRVFFRRHLNARFDHSTSYGQVNSPCQADARYRRFAFTTKHKNKILDITTISGKKVLSINSQTMTVVDGPVTSTASSEEFPDGSYEICYPPSNGLGDSFQLEHPTAGCVEVAFGAFVGNPPVQFDQGTGVFPENVVSLDIVPTVATDTAFYASKDVTFQLLRVTTDFTNPVCESVLPLGAGASPVVFGTLGDDYWVHDPRFEWRDNTPSNPLIDGGGTLMQETEDGGEGYAPMCSNVPRSFLNEDQCVISPRGNTCGGIWHQHWGMETEEISIHLTPDAVASFYELTTATRFVYAVEGLSVENDPMALPPCQPSATSRWVKTNKTLAECGVAIQSTTNDVLQNLIEHAADSGYVRDILFPSSGAFCDDADLTSKGFDIYDHLANQCWQNVHPDHLQIYDMTALAAVDESVEVPAESDSPYFDMSLGYDSAQWSTTKEVLLNVGTLGDVVLYNDLDVVLQTPEMAVAFGGEFGRGVLVCGSPGEVANDLSADGEVNRGAFDVATILDTTTNFDKLVAQRSTLWMTMALRSDDQLRQRAAWALHQLFVVSECTVEGARFTEEWVNYYDILVRHAFGNFRDLLKEISFSPMMGEMLTYVGSKSSAWEWKKNQETWQYADENYAREIMQLFTIGLYELNDDGTLKRDETTHRPISTYSNDDIMEYSRAWTGFVNEQARANSGSYNDNRIDPMTIEPKYRDLLPKMGLNGKYIGHGLPLCVDQPDKPFLKVGARYRILGYSPLPQLMEDYWRWIEDDRREPWTVDPNGGLFEALCAADPANPTKCTYPNTVILKKNIECAGTECEVDTLRTIEVKDGIHYEYVPPPCTHQAFYESATKVKKRARSTYVTLYNCADPRAASASVNVCADQGTATKSYQLEKYWGERVSLQTALQRVDEWNALKNRDDELCKEPGYMYVKNCPACNHQPYYWMATDLPCLLQAKINQDGRVALVHSVPGEEDPEDRERPETGEDSQTFFRVNWENPDGLLSGGLITDCGMISSECQETADGFCLCNTTATEVSVFDSVIPSRAEILAELAIGAFHPETYGIPYNTTTSGDVTMYAFAEDIAATGSWFSKETIFEFVDERGVEQRRKNLRSTVEILGTQHRFANPVHMMSLHEPTLRDALYETEATLDHYFYHSSTAPFVAVHYAKRFGASNPSPRYVEEITKAFRTGSYTYTDDLGSMSFGTGKYGDLAATIAATLLDREARHTLLDADPFKGGLREPLLKLMGMMRNTEFQSTPDYPMPSFIKDMQEEIGQMAYKAPSIFSFFEPSHMPAGSIAKAGLVAPEAGILTTSTIMSAVNGMMAMVKYGADRCFDGYGQTLNWHDECEYRVTGEFVNMSGHVGYTPTNASTPEIIVDELATIMTSGRLGPESRSVIADAVANEVDDPLLRAIRAEQLIVTTGEFHSTGTATKAEGVTRPQKETLPPSERPYKALVVIMLAGGADTYNLIVPHACTGTNSAGESIRDQYDAQRGTVALSDRSVVVNVTGQPCEQFAIHSSIPVVKELYDSGDLAMFLDTGVLNVPVSRIDHEAKTTSKLYAHNLMQKEINALDPYREIAPTGFAGRLIDVLNSEGYGYNAQGISINENLYALNGDARSNSPQPLVVNQAGFSRFNEKPETETYDPKPDVDKLHSANEATSSSIFADSWSNLFLEAIDESHYFANALENITLADECGSAALNMVVKMMATRQARGVDRDVFVLQMPGWDHHISLNSGLETRLSELNEAVACFADRLKEHELWSNVTTAVISEFGRTLTPNGNGGTDHGWSGNYMAFGGSLRSQSIFGSYPTDITPGSTRLADRGRVIPTLSFESMFQPMVEWMGIDQSLVNLTHVLPNWHKVAKFAPISLEDLYDISS